MTIRFARRFARQLPQLASSPRLSPSRKIFCSPNPLRASLALALLAVGTVPIGAAQAADGWSNVDTYGPSDRNPDTGQPNWAAGCRAGLCEAAANDGLLRITLRWDQGSAAYTLTSLACENSENSVVTGTMDTGWLRPEGSSYRAAAKRLSQAIEKLQIKSFGHCAASYKRPLGIYSSWRMTILLSTTGPQFLGAASPTFTRETGG